MQMLSGCSTYVVQLSSGQPPTSLPLSMYYAYASSLTPITDRSSLRFFSVLMTSARFSCDVSCQQIVSFHTRLVFWGRG